MAQQPPHDTIRVAARLANGFALDLIKLTGFGRDVIDGLLLAAISQANVARITRDPVLQRTYATLDQPPPDHLRRPVSVSAIANSLGLPYETARRRISALIELGALVKVGRGVILPLAPLNSPFYRMAASANFNLLKNLYFRLRAIGLLEDLPKPTGPPFAPEAPPVRLVIRLSSMYLLRLAEHTNRLLGDMVTTLIMMDLVQANTEHLADAEGASPAEDGSAGGFVTDGRRRPVRLATLAERLGIPQETVRRRLGRLMATGNCEKTPDGYLVPSRALAQDAVIRLMVDNKSHLYRLFGTLAEFGVLSEWESEVTRLRGAA